MNEPTSEVELTMKTAREQGVDFAVERGLLCIVLTLEGRRWILRDETERDIMLSLKLRRPAKASWMPPPPPRKACLHRAKRSGQR